MSIVEFNDAGEKTGPVSVKKVAHTEAEWRKLLTLQQFYVTRKGSSDLPYYGNYFKLHDAGIYRCICCGTAVFSSEAKFDSKSGFPCFSAPIAEENIRTFVDLAEEPQADRRAVQALRCASWLRVQRRSGADAVCAIRSNESALKFVPLQKSAGGA